MKRKSSPENVTTEIDPIEINLAYLEAESLSLRDVLGEDNRRLKMRRINGILDDLIFLGYIQSAPSYARQGFAQFDET